MNLIQQLQEAASIPFDTSTTHMATYDDMMKDPEYFRDKKHRQFKIVHMAPNDYIEAVVKGFGREHDRAAVMNREQKLIDEYAEKMKKGEKFPLVVLDHTSYRDFDGKKQKGFTQEGMHRSMAAKKIGVPRIPVMVVSDSD